MRNVNNVLSVSKTETLADIKKLVFLKYMSLNATERALCHYDSLKMVMGCGWAVCKH